MDFLGWIAQTALVSRFVFRGIIVLIATFFSLPAYCQTLNLPPRSATAPTGSEFASLISSMPVSERENWIYAQMVSGNVPNFLRSLALVSTNAVIGGTNHTISYFVTPDYLAIGNDEDYFLQPMSATLAQRLADVLNCSLPTRKMVNDIWTKAPVKLNPVKFSPATYNILSVEVFVLENNALRSQRMAKTNLFPLGALTGGCKKDVVLSNRIYTNFANASITKPVVIYGWHQMNGSPIQPLYNGHEESYADYSHGIRLVQMNVTVDGISKALTNVLNDPNLAALVSDEGVISRPRYTFSAFAPVITKQPVSQTLEPGATAGFSVLAAGSPPLFYQWKVSGTNLPAATNSILSLTNIQMTNAGLYGVTVSNSAGFATSFAAVLRVNASNSPILFQDNFETNSSSKWNTFWGSGDGAADHSVNFHFDYGTNTYLFNGKTFAIPPAPNSTNGSTLGLKISVNDNDANGWIAGVNVYPKDKVFSGNFALKFDLWLNYPGGAGGVGAGVSGSTEHAIFGINHLGSQANWAATNAASTDGIWFGVDGEGGTTRDYRAYVGNIGAGQTELINPAASGLAASDNLAGIYPALFPKPRFETNGAPGKNWVAVEVIQTNNNLIWKLDETVVAQRTNTSPFTNGNIMLGLMDTFSSIAIPAKDSFVIFDNVRVENHSELRLGAITKLPNGNFQIRLNGVASEDYWIEASTNFIDWSELSLFPGGTAPSVFVDDAAPVPFRFYRARRQSVPVPSMPILPD